IRLAGQQLGTDDTDFQATTVLIESLSSPIQENVELSAYLLGIYQPSDKRVVAALRSRLKTTHGHVRVHVAEALLRNDHENAQATEVLISELASGTRRMQMMSALAMHAAEGNQRTRCVKALIIALEDDDANVRAAAAAAVGGFGTDARQAAPALKKLTTDTNIDTARVAGVALRCVAGEPVE
ncbi:MAG: HEAT repeat domain-containing protein, partial [Planctomycetaceae bacterium]